MKRTWPIAVILALLLALSACGMGSASESAATASENPGAAQLSQTAAPAFSDVPTDAEYADAVKWCQKNGIMNGVSATAFDPDGTLTHAMLAAVLYRAEGKPAVDGDPAFTDTQPGAWYSDAAVWASENGLIRGYGNGLFGTDDPVTREQLTVILQRYRGEEAIWMDLLMNELTVTSRNGSLRDNPTVENYLHEAGLVGYAPSGTTYTDSKGRTVVNLGTHEHWNNSVDKKYSRNLGKNEGIELIYLKK